MLNYTKGNINCEGDLERKEMELLYFDLTIRIPRVDSQIFGTTASRTANTEPEDLVNESPSSFFVD